MYSMVAATTPMKCHWTGVAKWRCGPSSGSRRMMSIQQEKQNYLMLGSKIVLVEWIITANFLIGTCAAPNIYAIPQ